MELKEILEFLNELKAANPIAKTSHFRIFSDGSGGISLGFISDNYPTLLEFSKITDLQKQIKKYRKKPTKNLEYKKKGKKMEKYQLSEIKTSLADLLNHLKNPENLNPYINLSNKVLIEIEGLKRDAERADFFAKEYKSLLQELNDLRDFTEGECDPSSIDITSGLQNALLSSIQTITNKIDNIIDYREHSLWLRKERK